MSAHTPGPWAVHTSPNCWTVLQVGSSGRWHIAGGTAWGIAGKQDEAYANARLIAAAPDLLDHCIKALAAWEGTGPAILLDDLRAVIAKATGAA